MVKIANIPGASRRSTFIKLIYGFPGLTSTSESSRFVTHHALASAELLNTASGAQSKALIAYQADAHDTKGREIANQLIQNTEESSIGWHSLYCG